jgi:hypothetical protein
MKPEEKTIMGSFLKRRLVRLSPLIALAIFVIFIGPGRMGQLPGWARWAMVSYVFLAIIVPSLLGIRSGSPSAYPNTMAILRTWTHRFWISMLVLNVGAFVVGTVMILTLHNVIQVRYAILAPCANLLFILLLCWILYWSKKSKDSY